MPNGAQPLTHFQLWWWLQGPSEIFNFVHVRSRFHTWAQPQGPLTAQGGRARLDLATLSCSLPPESQSSCRTEASPHAIVRHGQGLPSLVCGTSHWAKKHKAARLRCPESHSTVSYQRPAPGDLGQVSHTPLIALANGHMSQSPPRTLA